MPTFPAPRPVTVTMDVPLGHLHVVAAERDDVVVTSLPDDPEKSGSVRAAEDVRVEHVGDEVTITAPGSWKQYVRPFAAGTARITVELPAGSAVRGTTGSLVTEGPLDVVEMGVRAGDARVETACRVALKISAGTAVVGHAGTADLIVGAGSVRVDDVAGDAEIKASTGTTTVGTVDGTLSVRGAHGDITVQRARGAVTARSSHAGIRVEHLSSGSASLSTSYGSIEVGVPEGTAAFLDVSSEHGTVRNQLTPTEGPVDDETTAEIHASTGYGDVIVRRPRT